MINIVLPWPFATIALPITEWLPKYQWKAWLSSDVTAGFTVFIVLIPQGMAYALLAGMPPIYGLYSAVVPLYIYAILGTSRQLSLGPMAITSLLLSVTAAGYGYEEQSSDYVELVLNLSMVVGICILLLGLFRLGALVNLISESVLVGFLTASASVIFLNQVKYILGLHVPRFTYTYQTIVYILSHMKEVNGNACGLGFATLAVLFAVRAWKKRNKATPERLKSTFFRVLDTLSKLSNFLCIIVGSLIAYAISVNGLYIDIVEGVPSGLRAPSFTSIGFEKAVALIPGALAISFVAFAGNWAVAKKYASERDYEVNATQELIAEGMSVTIGSVFNCFAGSGGLARSAVNAESGAQTQLSGMIAASLMLLAVQFLTSLFYYIPMAVLGAIIQVSVVSMLDFDAMFKAYHTHRKDCIVMVSTFMLTFFVGVSQGLIAGIALSIAMIIHATAFPSIVHVGKLPDSEGGHYKDVARFKNAHQHPGIAIIRMDATLFFANCAHFKDIALRAAAGEFHPSSEPIGKLIIDASCWMDIDLSAVQVLFELKERLVDKKKIKMSIVGAKWPIRAKLKQCHFSAGSPKHYYYYSIRDALDEVDRSDSDCSGSDEIHPPETGSSPYETVCDVEQNPLHRSSAGRAALARVAHDRGVRVSAVSGWGQPLAGDTFHPTRSATLRDVTAGKPLLPSDADTFSPLDDGDVELPDVARQPSSLLLAGPSPRGSSYAKVASSLDWPDNVQAPDSV
jgi:SulP family sulfate permease